MLGQKGVPASGVSAVVLNVTATEATSAGYVTAWPDGSRPTTSNLNLESADQTIANQVVIPVGNDGSIRLFTQSGGHFIADVKGWYTDDSASTDTTGLFIPVSPYRVVDSRSGGKYRGRSDAHPARRGTRHSRRRQIGTVDERHSD